MLKRLKWNHVIMSVLYIALGIFLLVVPGTALNVVCYALGGIVLAGAVVQLVRYFTVERGSGAVSLPWSPAWSAWVWALF